MRDSHCLIPTCQIRPGMVLLYNSIHWAGGRPWSTRFKAKGQEGFRKPYSGELSPGAAARLRRVINLLVDVAEWKRAPRLKSSGTFLFKVNFVTLTLPAAQGNLSDSELQREIFEPFLRSMRRKCGLKSYVWRRERQFNGNLHWHLTTDTYMLHSTIRSEWNRSLSNSPLMHEFESKHGHCNPNSTDVHSVNKLNDVSSYMVKYMSKSPKDHLKEINDKRILKGLKIIDPATHPFRKVSGQPEWDAPIEGRVWDCSLNLKRASKCDLHVDSELSDEINLLCDDKESKMIKTDHCYIIKPREKCLENYLTGRLGKTYDVYLKSIRDYVEPLKGCRRRSLYGSAPPNQPPLVAAKSAGGHSAIKAGGALSIWPRYGVHV